MTFPTFSLSHLLLLLLLSAGCSRSGPAVIVYASQDQVYAEPLLKKFQEQTGIQVRTVFDSEAVKTVGLANRLQLEKNHPQCDVFWNNEELRTRQLEAQGTLDPMHPIVAVGHRSRRIVINTNLVSSSQAPAGLFALTNANWRGKVALAYPLFGTTVTHFLALREHWGAERWEQWCRALQANHPLVADGNSVVVNLVGRGEAWVGLTDSDDIIAGQAQGLPIVALPLNDESLLIPNTVSIIRGAPHIAAAELLVKFLAQPDTLAELVRMGALEADNPTPGNVLHPDWRLLLRDLEPATEKLKAIFLR